MLNKNWDKKLFKDMVKDQFYDIDILKRDFGLKTDAVGRKLYDELGDEDIKKIEELIKNLRRFNKRHHE